MSLIFITDAASMFSLIGPALHYTMTGKLSSRGAQLSPTHHQSAIKTATAYLESQLTVILQTVLKLCKCPD